MHTAQHLVQNALSGDLARDRTIILVTHHISLCLPIASYLIELSGGRVLRRGSTQELQAEGQLDKIVEAEDVTPDEEAKEDAAVDLIDQSHGLLAPADPGSKSKVASGKLVEAEARAEGRVTLRTYWTYFRASGLFSWVLTVVLLIAMIVVPIGRQVSVLEYIC